MRQRKGNAFAEVHNDGNMVLIDWFAPAGTDVSSLPATIEGAVPSLKLHVPLGAALPYTVNGFVSTSTRTDGSVYVCLALYSQAFTDNPNVPIAPAPNLNPGQINQIVMACGGESGNPNRQLKGGNASDKAKDRANLTDAGFGLRDAPMLNDS